MAGENHDSKGARADREFGLPPLSLRRHSVRYGQDLIHTLFSRARFSIREGDYSIAKETARRSLLGALVRTGDLPTDHVRRGSSSAQVWSAAEEVSPLLALMSR